MGGSLVSNNVLIIHILDRTDTAQMSLQEVIHIGSALQEVGFRQISMPVSLVSL